ncbi:MAG: S41 family peptidase [Fimbriimonadaceae bacterium]
MLSATLLFAQMPAKPFMRNPDIHGNLVVYSSEGDLWLADRSTNTTKRLTSDAGPETCAQFSPDGKTIAYEASYEGSRQVYVIPTEGGLPKRLTYVEDFRAVTGWTPDGKNVVFRKRTVPTNYEYDLIPASGGAPTRLPLEFASHIWFGKTDQEYALTRFNRWSMAWFRYDGGMQNQIWVYRGGKFKEITKLPGTSEFPCWLGNRIYFVNEKDSMFALMSVSPDGGAVKTELPPSPTEIRELSTDGSKLVFENGPDCQVFDPATGKATDLEFSGVSDLIHMRNRTVVAESFATAASVTTTGKRALVEARGQILSIPFGEGESRVWKAKAGVRYRNPVMSPDAKFVSYFSDATGDMQLCVANADGSGERQITKDGGRHLVNSDWSPDGKWIALNDSKMQLRLINVATGEDKVVCQVPFVWFGISFDFSPDSKWIVHSQTIPITGYGAIDLYEIATGKTTRVSDGRSDDTSPSFSSDGKFLSYLSKRNISVTGDVVMNQLNSTPMTLAYIIPLKESTPDPFALKDADENVAPPKEEKFEFGIDFDGLWDRRIELPIAAGSYGQIGMFGSRLLLTDGGSIKAFDLASKVLSDFAPGGSFSSNAAKTKILIGSGPGMTVIDPSGDGKKTANFGALRLTVEPAAEWKQIFWNAWRLMRDYFYVANMHGLNWEATGKKYAAFLPRVRSRDELDELIRWMQSEVGSSHEYLSPGDVPTSKVPLPGAYLGIDVEKTPSGYYRITKILKGDGFRPREQSPLVRLGKKVKEGMYLIEVAGIPAKVGNDVFANLAGRAGRTVTIKVNTEPKADGATSLLVQPVAAENRMRYVDWVESNRRYVEKASGGRLGYLHMAAMTTGDMNDFVKQYFAQRDKEGLVIDTRFNNGGNVQDYVNRILSAPLTGFFNMRESNESWTRQQDYFLGPMVCVQNEFNISCGEEFPHRFRDLKRGPIIGRRTMGGEVGSSPGWPLIDGGVISVPNYGMWTPKDGWVIEGAGVSPDIDVPSDPNAYIQGKDPQLDRSIAWLLDDLRKNPPNRGKQPTSRDRVNGGG